MPQGSILEPIFFINDLSNYILNSFIYIYVDNTTIFGNTSKASKDQDPSDIEHILKWDKKRLVNLNMSKTKLLSFNNQCPDPHLTPTDINGSFNESDFKEDLYFDKLLDSTVTSDLT